MGIADLIPIFSYIFLKGVAVTAERAYLKELCG
ncbi:hypothetical protein [Dehalococcoides mccartyi]|nr:hypothetical protein [Dehalococcoides mccartyi]